MEEQIQQEQLARRQKVLAKLDELASLETPYKGMLKDSFCRPKEF